MPHLIDIPQRADLHCLHGGLLIILGPYDQTIHFCPHNRYTCDQLIGVKGHPKGKLNKSLDLFKFPYWAVHISILWIFDYFTFGIRWSLFTQLGLKRTYIIIEWLKEIVLVPSAVFDHAAHSIFWAMSHPLGY